MLIVGGPATAPSVVGRESRGRQHDSEQMATVVGADGARFKGQHTGTRPKSELSDPERMREEQFLEDPVVSSAANPGRSYRVTNSKASAAHSSAGELNRTSGR